MCNPVSAGLAVASMAGNMMQQQAAHSQAQGQYQYDLAMTAAMRQRDEALFNLRTDLVNESTQAQWAQIEEETITQQGIMASRLRSELNGMEEAASIARTSAAESGVQLPPGLLQQHFAKKAQVRAFNSKAVGALRKRAAQQRDQLERDRDAAIISALPPMRMDPMAPQEPSMFAMLLGGITSGMQGYVAGHQFGKAAGYIA